MRWLFPGKEVLVEADCLDCAEPVRVRMRDEEILEVSPAGAVAYAAVPLPRWGDVTWAFT